MVNWPGVRSSNDKGWLDIEATAASNIWTIILVCCPPTRLHNNQLLCKFWINVLFFKTSANIRWKKISHTWRTPTYEQQKVLRSSIIRLGLNATPVIDRFYFHSVYFCEPGRILFEIATNRPGFTTYEKVEELGVVNSCFLLGLNLSTRILRKSCLNYIYQSKREKC